MDSAMVSETRSKLIRYGIAVAVFLGILLVAALLRYYSVQLNLTILVAVGIAVASWYGGRGPGFALVGLIVVFAGVSNRIPEGSSTASVIFGYISVAAILSALVWLISGRRITERQLKGQGELLRITLASIGDGVIATDPEGRVTFVNSTAAHMLLCSESEPAGKPLGEVLKLFDDSKGEPIRDLFDRIKTRREKVSFATSISLECSDGSRIPIIDSGAPILDAGGRFLGAVVVFQDDRPRREAESERKEMEGRQQQSQKLEAVGRLTGGIAHDFNNLLTSMIGYTELAMTRLPASEDRIREYLVNVERAASRAAELTTKLLAFSRQQKLETRTIDLNASISDILRLMERVIGADVAVKFEAASGLHPVAADPTQIEQVIMNLSLNARDAMPRGGRLSIETRNVELDEHFCRQYPECQPGPYVRILVSDTGHGMDPETLQRVFEPFFTTKEAGAGTGLGLATAYGIIKQHGGHLSAYSEPNRGTTFKIFLPAAADGSVEDLPARSPAALDGGSETILIADDEPALRDLSGEVLESLGYRVLTAPDGEEALRIYKAENGKVDLLLLDVVMPTLGGIEVYRQLRHEGTGARVIFMTGYSSEMVSHAENTSGINFDLLPVIQKPYTLEALGKIVRETLDLARD